MTDPDEGAATSTEADPAATPTTTAEQIDELDDDELRERLHTVGLATTGQTRTLRRRLREHLDGGYSGEKTYEARAPLPGFDGDVIAAGSHFQAGPDDPRVKSGKAVEVKGEQPSAEQAAALDAAAGSAPDS